MTTIVAIYDNLGDAAQIRRELEASGIPARDINVSNNPGQGVAGTYATRVEGDDAGGGFLDWLFGVPERHVASYREGLERGNTLVTVRASEAQADLVETILYRYGPIDIEEQGARPAIAAGSRPERAAGIGREERTGEDVHIPVVEEELQVGKRAVERGGVRVRRYVVERPIEEQVRLRDETVRVERRPASGAAPASDEAFKERSYEMRERDEEAVVAKHARVREEVVLHKDTQEKTETVRDKVRRAEVEIEPAGPPPKTR